MDLCSTAVDECYSTNYWICKNGSRLHAIPARGSNRLVESRYESSCGNLLFNSQFNCKLFHLQGALSLQSYGWAATLICPTTTSYSSVTTTRCWRSPACCPWRPSPHPATPRRWRWSVKSSTAPSLWLNWNCLRSHCHCIPPTFSSKPVRTDETVSQTTFNLSILFSDRPGIRNVDEIRKLNEAVGNSLQKELMSSQALQQIKEEIPAINLLINKRHTLRYETVVTIRRRYLTLKYFSGI